MGKLSRREFVSGAAATAGLLAAGTGPAMGRGPFDVVIIGAGPAGIGAGRRLRAAGVTNFAILEGRPDRIGGRAFTDTKSFPGIVWDHGCQWLHQVTPKLKVPFPLSDSAITAPTGAARRALQPTNNVLFDMARAQGIPCYPRRSAILTPDLNPRVLKRVGKSESLLNSRVLTTEALAAIEVLAAGFATSQNQAADISVGEAIAGLRGEPWFDLVAATLELVIGGPIDELSCLDVFVMSAGGAISGPMMESIDNWLISTGYGAFITSLARGLPIRRGVVVKQIDWMGNGGVTLRTSAGTVRAKTVIVTAPVSVLPELFDGSLPAPYEQALAGLGMGTDEKIGLLFADGYKLPVPSDNTFLTPYFDNPRTSMVQTRAFGHANFAIVIVAGENIPAIAARKELVPYALDQMASMFGSSVKRAFRKGVASNWNTNQFSRGSYSFARPGGVPGRVLLGEPLADRVFLAGEAVNVEQHSSAHGAFNSGRTAARKVLKALAAADSR